MSVFATSDLPLEPPRYRLREQADAKPQRMAFTDKISTPMTSPKTMSTRPSENYVLTSDCEDYCKPSALTSTDGVSSTTPVANETADLKKVPNVKVSAADSSSDLSNGVGEVKCNLEFDESLPPAQPLPASGKDQVEYKSMAWWEAGTVMIAETISLGILALPHSIATIGFVPGVLLIAGLGLLATYTGYTLGQYWLKNTDVKNFADAAEKACGKTGRWIMEVAQTLVLVFIMAAHILTFSVMMNVLTEHGSCTVVFAAVGTVLSFLLTLPRTLKATSKISIFSCCSICAAVIIAMIGVALRAPGLGDAFAVTPSNMTTFAAGSLAVSNMIIAFTGHIAYFHIMSEMRKPKDFVKALALLQTCAITFYIVVAVVIYYYAGQKVTSPALASASPMVCKIAFGIAAPTIVVAGVINAHVAAKNVYLKVWAKQPDVPKEKSVRARGSWILIIAVLWIAAWLIASVIPVFDQLLGLIGALFCTWFALGFPAFLWLWAKLSGKAKRQYCANWKQGSLVLLNVAIFGISAGICVLGLYGSGIAISANDSTRAPFSCADNSVVDSK